MSTKRSCPINTMIKRPKKRRLTPIGCAQSALILLIISLFCLAAFKAILYLIEINHAGWQIPQTSGLRFLFMSFITMVVAGLGLITALLVNLRQLARINREKEDMIGNLDARTAAVATTMDGIAITDKDGVLRYANHAFAQYHGYDSEDDLIGRPWCCVYDEHECERIRRDILPLLETQPYWRGFCTGRKKDGSVFHQDISMTRADDGGLVWAERDMTDLDRFIELSDQRLAAIEAAADGIAIVDEDHKLTYMNKAMMSIYGLTEDTINNYMGRHWSHLYTKKGRKYIEDYVVEYAERHGQWNGEAPIMLQTRKDIIYAELSLKKLLQGGFIGTARDITDRKNSEAEREDLQKQFFQAQKMEAIGRMAGGMAHDFNNILASMIGYSEFLIEDIDPKTQQHEFARSIMNGAQQAKQLIEQILIFSRKQEASRKPVDLCDIVYDTCAMLRSSLPESINLKTSVIADAALVDANRTQITQSLINLCVNAKDAMDDKGSLAIDVTYCYADDIPYQDMLADSLPPADKTNTVAFENDKNTTIAKVGSFKKGQDYICASVSDDGPGIPLIIMEHIFEPFFTTKEIGKGTGLGLSSVHGIITGHQGAIVVHSREPSNEEPENRDSGTKFELYFPVSQNSAASRSAQQYIVQTYAGSGHILLVEDQNHVRDMLTHMLQRFGYNVTACSSALEAIDTLREAPESFNLVLTDHSMPVMTGADMAKQINIEWPDLPVILVSGHGRKKLESLMEEYTNIKCYLRKPLDSQSLSRALRDALSDQEKAA